MNVKPLSDRVLILPNPAEEKTAGGLIIPDTAKEKPLAGKVIAVGPGTSEIKMEVKVGDQALVWDCRGLRGGAKDALCEILGADRQGYPVRAVHTSSEYPGETLEDH